jgi:bis(5'-adenosyl)-triphosphatase
MSKVFYRTPHSFALVNLKPLLPGHVLVSPLRVVPRLRDLSSTELADLFQTVQQVGVMIERVYKASALNIAMQDGEAAGQSVKHIHTHIIPRSNGDLDDRGGGDAIYDMLERHEGGLNKEMAEREEISQGSFPKIDEAARKPRGQEEMKKEAEWLASEMVKREKL